MITYIIIAACGLLSYKAFEDEDFNRKLVLSPYMVAHSKQQYRIFSHAFIHGDWMHLIVNMYVLYMFGKPLEYYFCLPELFGSLGELYYATIYVGGIIAASIPAMTKHKDNPYYGAVGASGAISAVLFSFILINPMSELYLFFLIPMPAIVFGVLFIVYEKYMDKRGRTNVAHDAHYWGALFGFIITIILKPSLFLSFINKIMSSFS